MLALIYAQDLKGGIGKDNQLPWSNKEDLKIFREMTVFGTVAMGRHTWDSLPLGKKPLPMRDNIVVSNSGLMPLSKDYGLVKTVEDLEYLSRGKIVFVIGGASLIKAALPYSMMVFRTTINAVYDCDTFVESIDDKFHEESCLSFTMDGVTSQYCIYVKDKTFRQSPKYQELQRRYLQAIQSQYGK